MHLAYWSLLHRLAGSECVPWGGVTEGTCLGFSPSGSPCVSHATSTLRLLKDFSRARLTFVSNADCRPGLLFRSIHFILGPFYRAFGPSLGYWLYEALFLSHFWKPTIPLEFSGIHVLIHLFNKHFWSAQFVPGGASNGEDAKVCPWGDYGAEGLPRFPLKRPQVPGNGTEDVCLGVATGPWKQCWKSSPWWCVWWC